MTQITEFHLGDLLAVSTGTVTSFDGIAGVQRLLEHLVGRPVWTDELAVLAGPCREALVSVHPQLNDIVVPPQWQGNPISFAEVEQWVLGHAERLGSLWWPVPSRIVQL